MFIGLEAIDEEGLKKHRKRVSLGKNFEALEFARSLGIMIAINLIADPDWDHERFRIVREWGVEQPEVVNLSVNTPYPGTESWLTAGSKVASRDYRLYDIQHAVLPTRLPLAEFYDELVTTQRAFYRKHLGVRRLMNTAGVIAGQLARGQTNFVKSLFKLNQVFRPELLLADHARAGRLRNPAAIAACRGGAGGGPGALCPRAARPRRTRDRRRDRAFCRGDAHGEHAVDRVCSISVGWRGSLTRLRDLSESSRSLRIGRGRSGQGVPRSAPRPTRWRAPGG